MDNLVAMNNAGPEDAVNEALFAASMLAKKHPHIRNNLINYRRKNNDVLMSTYGCFSAF